MNNIQLLINGMNEQFQRERTESQMTLGSMIKKLESMPAEAIIKGLGSLNSYRGFYCDLAFAPTNKGETISSLLERCKSAMGEVFEGYKGGEYVMGSLTPIWLAGYGDTGDKIVAINDDGTIETTEYDYE